MQNALYPSFEGRKKVPHWVMAAGIAALFFGSVLIAHWTGHWHTNLPEKTYMELVPRANEFVHP